MTREQHAQANKLYNEIVATEAAIKTADFGDVVWVSFHDTRNEKSEHIALDEAATKEFQQELREYVKQHLQTRLAELKEEYANL